MGTNGLIFCAECGNKHFVGIDDEGRIMYYCKPIDGVVKDGIVYNTTDASACLELDLYKPKYPQKQS